MHAFVMLKIFYSPFKKDAIYKLNNMLYIFPNLSYEIYYVRRKRFYQTELMNDVKEQ